MDSILKALNSIQEGERTLESEYNEEWDDWYNSTTEEFLFSDPEHVLDDIKAAVNTLHQCIDEREYEAGAKLAVQLSKLNVPVIGDYDGGMSLQDLYVYDLLDEDVEQVAKEAIYAVCMNAAEADRADAMVRVMDGFGCWSVTLEEILQTGEDEIDLKGLLPSWIEALQKWPASRTDRLLKEAQGMLEDRNAILENASRYAESHPALYESLLRSRRENADSREMMEIGLRAMREVPVLCPERSAISLLTADYAHECDEHETAENCYMEAFRSLPTAENYMRLRLESSHWENHAEAAREAYLSFYERKSSWDQEPLAPILFFDERFKELEERFMDPGEGIGWSSTFMKEGISMMLMTLYEGNQYQSGMKTMQSMGMDACSFSTESYCEGIGQKSELPDEAMFQKCFEKWKADIVLSEDTRELWLNRIDNWIALRVSAIMARSNRKYYGECAAFIAAYGEVMESRNNPGAKDAIMQQYRQEYSRRRAFHDELRCYGMRK